MKIGEEHCRDDKLSIGRMKSWHHNFRAPCFQVHPPQLARYFAMVPW